MGLGITTPAGRLGRSDQNSRLLASLWRALQRPLVGLVDQTAGQGKREWSHRDNYNARWVGLADQTEQ